VEIAGSRPRVRGSSREWEYEGVYDDDSVREQDPLWLLELIAATTRSNRNRRGRRRMMLELSDFGGPPGIDLPSPDEIHVGAR
jgi:hypothetical protein